MNAPASNAVHLQTIARRASEVLAHAGDPVSPCVSVCRMQGQSALCEGCLRTIEEIAGWSGKTAVERRAVWHRIGERAAALQQA